jgi:hypothetical protein
MATIGIFFYGKRLKLPPPIYLRKNSASLITKREKGEDEDNQSLSIEKVIPMDI